MKAPVISERTVIIDPPRSQTVNASSDVTFHCRAATDPAEVENLRVDWLRGGEVVQQSSASLTLSNVQLQRDSGNYTCLASNGLDSDQHTAQLTIKGS